MSDIAWKVLDRRFSVDGWLYGDPSGPVYAPEHSDGQWYLVRWSESPPSWGRYEADRLTASPSRRRLPDEAI